MTMRYRRRAGVSVTELDDEAFLVPPGGGDILILNATGLGIWRLLESACSADAIIEVFASAFPETPIDALARDVDTVLTEMQARGLIEPET